MNAAILAIAGLGLAITSANGGYIEFGPIRLKRDNVHGARYTRFADTHMIDTDDTVYAIAAPELARFNWLTVAVNGSEAVIYTSSCERTRKRLGPSELAFVEGIRAGLFNASADNQLRSGSRSVVYVSREKIKVSDLDSDRLLTSRIAMIHHMEDGRLSAGFDPLTNGVELMFALGDLVGLAHLDKKVQLKPLVCLSAAEREFYNQFMQNVIEAEEFFKMHQDRLNPIAAELDRLIFELSQLDANDPDLHRRENVFIWGMDKIELWRSEIDNIMRHLTAKFLRQMKGSA